jgi:hypothetical protein
MSVISVFLLEKIPLKVYPQVECSHQVILLHWNSSQHYDTGKLEFNPGDYYSNVLKACINYFLNSETTKKECS